MWLRITTVVAVLVLAAPLAAEAQEAQKVPRIGILHQIPPSATFQAFRKGLQELGYVEGRHVHLEYRWPEGGVEGRVTGYPALAAQLVQSRFDVILAISSGAARAVKRPRTPFPSSSAEWMKIPSSLGWPRASPDREATSRDFRMAVELEAKRLELLKEAVPGLSRVAVLWNPSAGHQGPRRTSRRRPADSIPMSSRWRGKAPGTSRRHSGLPAVSERAVCLP